MQEYITHYCLLQKCVQIIILIVKRLCIIGDVSLPYGLNGILLTKDKGELDIMPLAET